MRPQHSLRIVFAFLLAITATACDSPTGGKSRDLPVLSASAPVSGSVEPAAADSFALALPGGEFRVLLRATSGSVADSLVVSVITDAGAVITTALSVGTDTDITAQATAWLLPPAEAKWKVEVRGQGPNDGGAYTLQIFPRNTAPERAAAALTLGQAVDGELLDVPGDVDEFTIDGAAGDEWILFGQSLTQVGAQLRMELVERSSGQVIGTTAAAATTPALESQSSGRVVLPRAGTYLVRIAAEQKDVVRGAYRFRLDRVNRAPETRTAPAALGDVLAETIGSVGDVDEFTFNSPAAGQEMNLLVQQGMSPGLQVQVLRAGQLVRELEAAAPAASLDVEGTGRFTLDAAGPYTIRVLGQPQGTPATATGAYRLELYPVDRRAEAGGQLRLDGGPVASAIDRPGDVDEYEITGTAGQLVVIAATHPAGSGALQAVLMGPVNSLATAELSPDQTSGYSFRVILPVTGTHKVRVWAPASDPMAFGAFTVEAYSVNPAPEHVSATLTFGETVTTERIDRPGDLDVFTFAGQAGRTVNVFVGVPANAPQIPVSVRAETHAHTFIFTYGGPMSMDGMSTGRIPTENTGYVVKVDPQQLGSGGTHLYQGPYRLRLFEINRSPESGSAAYVLGDTVTGEPLYPLGDIDEYRFQLSESTPLRVLWDAPFTGSNDPVAGVIYDEDTNRPVWHAFSTTGPGEYIREFTLPAGRYRLSVLNQNVNAPSEAARFGVARLNYRFAFMRR